MKICKDCYVRLLGIEDKTSVIMLQDFDVCDECGEHKQLAWGRYIVHQKENGEIAIDNELDLWYNTQ